MVKKLQKIKASKNPVAPLAGSVKDSAQQIWQKGLGALNKAQAEGSKALEALVKEGRKTQSAAEGKLSEATNRVSNMATDISSKATGQWDKLENIFEDRVAKALNKLGVPSAKDVNILIARIDELNKSVQKLSAKGAAPQSTAKSSAKATPKASTSSTAKPTAKRSAVRKSKVDVSPTPSA
jgi:poly(hydroxyalkanoate) granule-associated protein